MIHVLHTARIRNVKIVMSVIYNKDFLFIYLLIITKLQHKENKQKKGSKKVQFDYLKKDRSNKRTLIVYKQSDISS